MLQLEPSEQRLLASASTDGTVRIWDVRRLGACASGSAPGTPASLASARGRPPQALSTLNHSKSVHAACWASDGSKRIASTSYDDTIRVWGPPAAAAAAGGGAAAAASPKGRPAAAAGPAAAAAGGADDGAHHTQLLTVKHNNQTGRWITPFRCAFHCTVRTVRVRARACACAGGKGEGGGQSRPCTCARLQCAGVGTRPSACALPCALHCEQCGECVVLGGRGEGKASPRTYTRARARTCPPPAPMSRLSPPPLTPTSSLPRAPHSGLHIARQPYVHPALRAEWSAARDVHYYASNGPPMRACSSFKS